MPRRVFALLLALAPGAGCRTRTWVDVPVVELRTVPSPPDATCAALAGDLAARGTALEVERFERTDATLLPLDETLILRGYTPTYRRRDRTIIRRAPADGFDAGLQCGGDRFETPLAVRLCVVDGVTFGVVDPAIYRRLPEHGLVADGCRLWGRVWFGDETSPWLISVVLRPPVRARIEEAP